LDVNTYADNYFNFKFALEDTLHRPVDLLEDKAIKIHILEKQLKTSADLFMDIELKTWLYDILSALHEIETFTSNTSDFSAYQSDL
jgi:hypothetical protein